MAGAAAPLEEEEIVAILERVAGGLTLKQSCKKARRDYPNVVKRIHASDPLKQLYAHAREEYARGRVQDMHDIAKNPRIDPQRARVMIDVIKWETSRVLPKEFGDRVQQEVILTHNTTLSSRMSTARARARAMAAAAAAPAPVQQQDDDAE